MKFFLCLLFFILSIAPAWPQNFDDFGADDKKAEKIFKKKKKEKSALYEFWKKSGKGTLGATRVIGPDTNRGYTFLDLRLDHTFAKTNTKVVLAGILEYADVKVSIDLKASEQNRRDGSNDGPRELKKKFKYDATEIRPEELYIKQDLFNAVSLSYGFQKVVLGQFDPFSPNNFAMPWNLSSLSVGFNKTQNTLPQQVALMDLYPHDKIQLSLYYFPKLTYDRLVSEELQKLLSQETGGRRVTLNLPKGSKEAQKMVRLMFYPSWGTVGLTYYNGYHSTFPVSIADLEPEDLNNPGSSFNKVNEYYTFAKNEMFSFEMAIPVGRFVYKAEYARHKDLQALSSSGYNAYLSDGSGQRTPEAIEFTNAIAELNGGSINIPFYRHIGAVGFTANFTRWYLNFMAMYMGESYKKGPAQQLVDLEEKAKKSSNSDEGSSVPPIIPGLIASYYLDGEKQKEIGLGGGILGSGFGAMVFYRKQSDSFTYSGGLQAISYFSNRSLEDSLPEGYELSEEMTFGLTFNLSYSF